MSLPDQLWHYTDAVGLYGILTSDALRLSDTRFLNDRTELRYGRQVCHAVLEAEISQRHGKRKRYRYLTEMLPRSDRGPASLFVASLSEKSDSISQWQRYGADGSGYCVGFDASRIHELEVRPGEGAVRLVQVAYDLNEQQRRVRDRFYKLKPKSMPVASGEPLFKRARFCRVWKT